MWLKQCIEHRRKVEVSASTVRIVSHLRQRQICNGQTSTKLRIFQIRCNTLANAITWITDLEAQVTAFFTFFKVKLYTVSAVS